MHSSSKDVAFKTFTTATFLCYVAAYSLHNFDKDGVVPDIIDKAPTRQLKLLYGSIDVLSGMVLTPSQVKDRPKVEYEAEKEEFYTLIMNDPDAPSRKDPVMGEWHHWLVTNIPGADVSKGEEVTQYVGAGPPKGTGLHRYVFLLYKQPKGKMNFKELPKLTSQSGDRRANNKVREFVKKYEMGKHLVAGNFFQAEYDDYVPQLHSQLAGKHKTEL
ncbi:hypothetical protein CHS0354_004478 [Potamilus streckersoni]|uniref:Uncharacterized protein n=1 Tax=Potamilus streckersoni TaxID=2493646 RepID=A0AAE0SP27_9BIVA|nr:hypothetical protein CHS0354_004478 [Potamilus streckersoni]